jgi:hypothetical protein
MFQQRHSQQSSIPHLVGARCCAVYWSVLRHASASALTARRHRPNWIELEGKVSYDVALRDDIAKNTRVASVRAAMEETRETV